MRKSCCGRCLKALLRSSMSAKQKAWKSPGMIYVSVCLRWDSTIFGYAEPQSLG
jgi:hypothetical protein